MWTGKIFKKAFIVSCAMFVPFCELMAQDETVYTAKYKFNYYSDNVALTPVGTQPVGTSFSYAGNYKRSSKSSWKDRVYLDKNNEGKITFTNFKYEVTQVEYSLMAEAAPFSGSDNISGTFTNYNGNTSKTKSGRVGATIPNTFNSYIFLNSSLNGLKSMTMKQLNSHTVYYEGANDNTTPTFTIKYYEPSVSFKKTMPSQIKLGQTLDVSKLDTIYHQGAFNFTTTYKSSNENIFTVDKNGVITPKNLGKANITVTITDGKVSNNVSKVIEVINPQLASNQYDVVLMYNDKTTDCETVIATYGQNMPTVTPPTRTGYTFRGYFDNESYSQTSDNNSTKYYNADGTSARTWNKQNNNEKLYGHWTAKTYTINFDACGGKLSDKVGIRTEGQDRYIKTSNDQSFVSFDVQYGSKIADRFWCSDEITIKPGYKFLGWFTEKTGGTKVYSVDDKECSFNAIEGDYWTAKGTSGDWKYDATSGTLNLYAQYECKFEIVDNGERINFKKGYDITSYDILAAIEEDIETYKVSPMIVDVTKYQNYIMAGKGLGGFLGGKGLSVNEYDNLEAFNTVIEEARLDNKLASNALVYLSGSSSMYTDATNVVMTNEQQCKNLVVTDRAPIKVPYAFKAEKALYERNKNYSSDDAAKAQAANSKWGTLCLPYPIKNNTNNVKFYKLAGLKNNYMHFTPMEVDVIPANTPVLYKRLEGVGSEVKIEEADVDVPVNTSYFTNSGESYDSWKFVGTLTTKMFCGKDYKNVPEGAEKLDGSKEYYYFKQDKFTHLSKTGSLIILPYRAYFTTTPANAKFTTFSIIAMDEEGATDITNLIDNDAEGDGKIYDLNGRRVMQPVSGRLYIVNGQKKVY